MAINEPIFRYVRDSELPEKERHKWSRPALEGELRKHYLTDGRLRDCRQFIQAHSALSDGDYNPNGSIGRSNMRVWLDSDTLTEDSRYHQVKHSSYGYREIQVRIELSEFWLRDKRKQQRFMHLLALVATDETYNLITSILDNLESLNNYPLLDDDDHSQLEMEESWEAWKDYGCYELKDLINKYADDHDLLPISYADCRIAPIAQALWQVYEELGGLEREYPYCEGEMSYHFPDCRLDDLSDEQCLNVLLHVQDHTPKLPWEMNDVTDEFKQIWGDYAEELGIKKPVIYRPFNPLDSHQVDAMKYLMESAK